MSNPPGLTTLKQASLKYGFSVSWWAQQAARGAFRTVQFGSSRAIPSDEMERILKEGLPPLNPRKQRAQLEPTHPGGVQP